MSKFWISFLTFLFFSILSVSAFAHSFKTGDINIGHPWAPPTPVGEMTGKIYLAFLNNGGVADQLTGASTSVARKITLQQSSPDGTVSESNAIDLPIGRGVALRPGASYLKLEGLKGGLTAGDRFTVRLKFASAKEVDVTVIVEDQGHQH